jgi:hypothetical protein
MRAAVLALLLLACGSDGPPWYYPPATTHLVIHVTEGGTAIPSRLLLYDQSGAPVRIGTLDMFGGQVQDRGFCKLADGAIGTWMGIALARRSATTRFQFRTASITRGSCAAPNTKSTRPTSICARSTAR